MCTRYYPCKVYLGCGHFVYGKPYTAYCNDNDDEKCFAMYEDLLSDDMVYAAQCDDCFALGI